ncbi:DUF456 domain-containing protein [Actinotalea fermentans]|uniref:DUF456 domain-containing protein n=1 Tax=Actinotalea fermentans TaxID=43671 RepID=A0A511YU48_9CELL|nr:DUF456 domain-containing protein [Actinotalea fermentans]KGM17166.1 hypothetical protein N867_09165 [Actinotalea fermentans ATCC 43279 = JCM 9966 = DSM 3133]GEN78720.1 hypothetical protein AFE02nite_04540 [Actinotalea fermentans]
MDLVAVGVGLAILVGLVGIVLPVLPGSAIIALAVLVWAIDTGGWAWAVLAAVVLMLAAGWSASYVIPGRRVAVSGVPRSSFVVAGLAGVVGFFVLPVLGLLVFFPAGLYLMEYRRLRDPAAAWASAWLAIRMTALGMLIELGLGLLAAATWLVAELTAF